MAIDIEQERIIDLSEAARVLPRINGKKPSISTLWRWCRIGLRGVRLEYVKVGRNIATSLPALNRFFVELAKAEEPLDEYPRGEHRSSLYRGPAARLRAIRAAEKRLEEAGL
ncbi:MAG: DUF1580 domain-containing protein [Planctomycetaceae bacterium]|nr:DUF1580 domain-containing protein [Planctomycetaceae bacterium]